MTDEEKQDWELENGKVLDAYQEVIVHLNLNPIYEVRHGKEYHKLDGERLN